MTTDEAAKALDRIQKLMRLATNNPNEDEARSAALQAIKLIAQHGFSVVIEQPVVRSAAPSNYPPYSPPSDPFGNAYERHRQQQEAMRQQFDREYQRWREASAESKKAPPPRETPRYNTPWAHWFHEE